MDLSPDIFPPYWEDRHVLEDAIIHTVARQCGVPLVRVALEAFGEMELYGKDVDDDDCVKQSILVSRDSTLFSHKDSPLFSPKKQKEEKDTIRRPGHAWCLRLILHPDRECWSIDPCSSQKERFLTIL